MTATVCAAIVAGCLFAAVALGIAIFISFSLVAPPRLPATIALVVSAFSVAGAFFLILELDEPFGGLIRISSAPMVNALSEFTQCLR